MIAQQLMLSRFPSMEISNRDSKKDHATPVDRHFIHEETLRNKTSEKIIIKNLESLRSSNRGTLGNPEEGGGNHRRNRMRRLMTREVNSLRMISFNWDINDERNKL